jgi:hypothetical protein
MKALLFFLIPLALVWAAVLSAVFGRALVRYLREDRRNRRGFDVLPPH